MNIDLRDSWNRLSRYYQSRYTLDTGSAHYGVFAPDERQLRLLGDVAGRRILELGCGGAQCSIAFARQGAECVAVDLSDEQIAFARELAAREGVQVDLHRGEMIAFLRGELPGRYDVVFSAYAFQYVEDLVTLFAEVRRVLQPGGLFVFSLDHPLSDITRRVESQVVVAESYFKRGRMEWDWDTEEGESAGRFYSFHRTVGDFVNLLFGAGFVVEALHEPEPPAKTDLWGADHAQYTQVPATIIWRARANR